MKLRYWIAIGLTALIAVIAAGTAVLLETEAGLRWTVAFVESRSHGAIKIGAVHGRLAGPLSLDRLRVTLPGAMIEVHHLEGDWRPWALVAGELRISHLRGAGVRIVMHSRQEPFQGLPAELKLPLHIIIGKARFDGLTLENTWHKLQLNRLAFTLDADDANLRLEKLEAHGPRIALAGQLHVQPHGNWPLHARLGASLRPPGYPELRGSTRLDGTLRGKLELEQMLNAPFEADLKASVTRLFDAPNVRGTLHVARLDPRAIKASWPELRAGADLEFDGGLRRFAARGTVMLANGGTRTVDLDLKAGISKQRLHIEQLDLALANSPARLSLRGTLALDTPYNADLAIAWKDLRWPLDATEPIATAAGGGAHLQGNPGGWTLDAETLLRPRDLPQGRWALRAQGNREEIAISSLAGRWLGGTLTGRGKARLEGAHPFGFSARASGLQTQTIATNLQGHIGFDFAVNGNLAPLQAQVRLSKLGGTLSGRPIKGEIALAYADNAVAVRTFTLAAGANRFAAEGRWGKNANLEWRLHAPELAALGQGLGGKLEARGSISGTVAAPRLKANLAGEHLRRSGLGIERLRAQADIDLAARSASSLELHVENIVRGRLQVHRLDAELDGPSDAQHFSLALDTNEGGVKLAGNGRLDHGRWTGKLTTGELSPTRETGFVLRSPADLTLGPDKQELGRSCWRGPRGSEFCLAAASDAQGWKADADLQDLPLDLADPWLTEGLALNGIVNGTLTAAGGGGRLSARTEIHVGHGSVTRSSAGRKQRVAFSEAGLEARLDHATAHARLGVILADGGTLEATAEIPWRTHAEPAGKLHLLAHLPDLSGAGALSDAISDVGGRLDADLEISGSLASPRFKGDVRLSHAAATLTRFGTRIRNGSIVLHGTGANLRVEGEFSDADDGYLALRGTFEHAADQWTLDTHLQGKNFRVADMPEIQVKLSPNLNLTVADYAITLNGSIVIPSAHIKPPHFSDAIEPTPDLVIVGGRNKPSGPPWRLSTRLNIRLGDDVHFAGYGLTARIGGGLDLNKAPGRLTTASGELKIMDGNYRAYGQDLGIQHGSLLFSGGPIDNPGLDVRAVRNVGMVTAGLQITGTLRNPALRVFSDPPMPQSDALAYLLFGHGVQQNSGSENSTLNQAASAIGIAGSTYLAKSLGKRVGIDTVSVENASPYTTTTNQASLFLGKYLSPRLYVSYGIGLYAPINLLRVRYTLSRHWALQAESGTISGADILFNIEH